MREVVFDIETRGLDCQAGTAWSKSVVWSCETVRSPTSPGIHVSILSAMFRPKRSNSWADGGLPGGALLFKKRAQEFFAFIRGAHLVADNAPFDLGFVNTEPDHCGFPPVPSIRRILAPTFRNICKVANAAISPARPTATDDAWVTLRLRWASAARISSGEQRLAQLSSLRCPWLVGINRRRPTAAVSHYDFPGPIAPHLPCNTSRLASV